MKPILFFAAFAALCWGQQTRGLWTVSAESQTSNGHIYHLEGHAELRGSDVTFRADSIDYDEDRSAIHMSGHVTIETVSRGALSADEADYDVASGDLKLKVKLTPSH